MGHFKNIERNDFIFGFARDMTSRNWCFTLNNFTTEEEEQINNKPAWIKFVVYQEEKGETGTPHLQGYLETKSPVRLSKLQKMLGRAHWERRLGTREEALKYVMKEDSRVRGPCLVGISDEELILLKNKSDGATDLNTIKEKIGGGADELTIANEHFGTWVRYYKAFERYRCLLTKPRSTIDKVILVVGPTGTGKSRFCLEQYPNAYWKQRSNWWCGYSGESTVIIDEFYGWLPFDMLLRLCDRYPMLLETKGGQCQCVATTVVITSNGHPDTWYKNCYLNALYRRFTNIIYMPELGVSEHLRSMTELSDKLSTFNFPPTD